MCNNIYILHAKYLRLNPVECSFLNVQLCVICIMCEDAKVDAK